MPDPLPSGYPSRKDARAALIAARQAMAGPDRGAAQDAITRRLRDDVLPYCPPGAVGLYWPFRGEYDPRPLAAELHAAGVVLALPVVVAKAQPLAFRRWRPGDALVNGVWDIPIPAVDDRVAPALLLVPLVGFDASLYRLGYGGGFYDRTIAAAAPQPFRIGVGFELARLATIGPRPHDIPMNRIATERTLA